jgi:pimeloyl-ACP methyl ester carboxylesterase
MLGRILVALIVLTVALPAPALGQTSTPFTLRGSTLTLHVSGPASGEPVIVASGDGGWIHLGPYAASVLAASGYFVVGLDSKQYLSSFTSGARTLDPRDEPGDFAALCDFASRSTKTKVILVGVSEGAGLSVLAASDPRTREKIRGVVGLGLPDVNELGWRFRDSIIYLTKGVPNEPTFRASDFVERVAPLPLAAIHSTSDEFVPLDQIRAVMDRARDPKRLWIVKASNHRFSGNEKEFEARLLEAMEWVKRGGR